MFTCQMLHGQLCRSGSQSVVVVSIHLVAFSDVDFSAYMVSEIDETGSCGYVSNQIMNVIHKCERTHSRIVISNICGFTLAFTLSTIMLNLSS